MRPEGQDRDFVISVFIVLADCVGHLRTSSPWVAHTVR